MDYEVYDQDGNLITEYDLELGRLQYNTRTVEHPAIEGVMEEGHYEVIREYPNGGKDVAWIVDVEGVNPVEAWTEEIPYYTYIPYTEEELKKIEEERNKPSLEEEIEILKTSKADQSEMEALVEAITKGLSL